jgi:opacity protein-like surface antigen
MKQSSLVFMLALIVTAPRALHAEPVSITLQSSSGGFDEGESAITTSGFTIDLGTLVMPAADASGTYVIDGLKAGSDYTVSFNLTGASDFRVEVLDPIDGDDALDQPAQPSYVPAGYSTSNNLDGFSFAQDSPLARSAAFLGGSATVVADENTNRGDLLAFTGLGTGTAAVTFGLRDRLGERGFLLRLSAIEGDPAAVPEPASMLLIGSGLAALIMGRRRTSAYR